MFFMAPLLYRNAWGSKVGLELKEFQPAISPVALIAFATETLLPSVLMLVAFPPLNNVAIAALGVSETPAASPASLRAKPSETLFPDVVPRSVTLYCCAKFGAAQVSIKSHTKPVVHAEFPVVDM
jgi:hypothetical protein